MMEFSTHILKSRQRLLWENTNKIIAQSIDRSLCLIKKKLNSVGCDISMAAKRGNLKLIAAKCIFHTKLLFLTL